MHPIHRVGTDIAGYKVELAVPEGGSFVSSTGLSGCNAGEVGVMNPTRV